MSIMDWYRRVQYTTGMREHPVIESLKKQAKHRHRSGFETTLMQSQDQVARNHGYMHWHHAQQVVSNYDKAYKASLQLDKTIGGRSSAFSSSEEGLRDQGSRWLGFDELSSCYVGQRESTQLMHTLVIGQHIGPAYFNRWLHDHLRLNEGFFAWVNTSAWHGWTLKPNVAPLNPLLLRMGTSHVDEFVCARAQAVEIEWAALSEMHAWVNVMQPDLAQNQAQSALLEQLLAWVWGQLHHRHKTGVNAAACLVPLRLSDFPGWHSDCHTTLLLAGSLAVLLRHTQPFNRGNESDVCYLTVEQLFSHPTGAIILDDGDPTNEVSRLCVQGWMRSYLGHRLGVSSEGPRLALTRPPASERRKILYWYLANVEMNFHFVAQCRALRIALSDFRNQESDSDTYARVRANSVTLLQESPQSPLHALYTLNDMSNAPPQPLRCVER